MSPRDRALLRLRELLEPATVRRLLPDGLERMVTACERSTRLYQPPAAEGFLYELLLDHHDFELFREHAVRQAVLKNVDEANLEILLRYDEDARARSRSQALEIVAGRNWHPGKRWARFFTHHLDLPEELAGNPDGGGMPTVEILEPYVPLPRLHDFQAALVDRLMVLLRCRSQGPRAILSLPTGAGKTRTMMEALVRLILEAEVPPSMVLWIAQSEELCEQAVQSVREVWASATVQAATKQARPVPHTLHVHRLWGSHRVHDVGAPSILVAGIQKLDSLLRRSPQDLQAVLERSEVVVIDEAHHAIAPSYTELFRFLGLERGRGERAVFGLTATPYRGNEPDTRRLVARFQSRLIVPPWENAVIELRALRILAQSKPEEKPTSFSIKMNSSELKQYEQMHDLPKAVLRRMGQDRHRNRVTLDVLLQIEPGRPVLFFACSVAQASTMAVLLRRSGREAVSVTSDTPVATRRQWVQKFKDGEIQFLCNYGVLTTGFDAPRVEYVVIGRPTTSVLLYEQMVGRGMRGTLNGGTDVCHVIDLVDNFGQYGDLMSYDRYRDLWKEFSKLRLSLPDPDSADCPLPGQSA